MEKSTAVTSTNTSSKGPVPQQSTPAVSYWKLLTDHSSATTDVLDAHYSGSGACEDPFVVEFLDQDPRNAKNFSRVKKWTITVLASLACLFVSLCSSIYTAGISDIEHDFDISTTTAQLGVSLFVAGFAIGPLIWAPLSEIYGRQLIFFVTYGAFTIFCAASAASATFVQLVVFRFLAGAFGSSPITNAAALIADIFDASDRGMAMSLFSMGPFMGPVLGPICGGFLGDAGGWRWLLGLTAILTGINWIVCSLVTPETYGPYLLRMRAAKLSKSLGRVYVSESEKLVPYRTPLQTVKIGLLRPWALLFVEPVVLIISIYMAVIYGTVYMLFAAYPIIFKDQRGWSNGMSGLAFLGIAVGMVFAFVWMRFENRRYQRKVVAASAAGQVGPLPPEQRLPPCMVGAVAAPVGLFWFAWTNSGSIHWMVCILGSVFFGFANVLLFVSCMNYLVDAYTVWAASCMAASTVLRSVVGAVFPLFTPAMYKTLGINWASSVPAFLTLACLPFPFLFARYGKWIREHSNYMRK